MSGGIQHEHEYMSGGIKPLVQMIIWIVVFKHACAYMSSWTQALNCTSIYEWWYSSISAH